MSELSPAEIEAYAVDKTRWPRGEWDTEPDRVQWEASGFPCIIVRHDRHGFWCGYVGVDETHPLYGVAWDTRGATDDLSFGVNYSRFCQDVVCHVAKPGESDKVYWLGFDCGHGMQLAPGIDTYFVDTILPERRTRREMLYDEHPNLRPRYVNQAEVMHMTEQLAKELRTFAK